MTLPISVVIPCYKQEQWIAKAIISAHDADVHDVQVYYDQDTPFRVGVCYARNKLIAEAESDLILCLDADDRLYPDALQRLYSAWQPGTWVYGDAYTEIDENEAVIREMQNPPPQMIFRKNLTFSTFLFHRDDWRRVGGFNPDFEPLEEDYAYQCALVDAGIKAVRVDNCLLYRRMIHSNSRTAKAMRYWNVTLEMCREKYPGAFVK